MAHFLFGIHCHQPAHNFSQVVDIATASSYAPFLAQAAKVPPFKFAVHYSGWLLEYLRTRHADIFSLLQKLAQSGQIEFFTGGYYEPILSTIPHRDRVGQIRKLSEYIHTYFGQYPKGLWLTERVWDPSIILSAAECGVEYMLVDDYHFLAAGFEKETTYGYFITEQDTVPMKIFSIDKQMRYLTPFSKVEEVISYMDSCPSGPNDILTVFDDGEKFGLWPDTADWVYSQKWLSLFMQHVTQKERAHKITHFSEIASSVSPIGIVYLPMLSYPEMGEWALFADRYKEVKQLSDFLDKHHCQAARERYVRGSIWKNFLVKYPESNRLHKRALWVSSQLNRISDPSAELIDAVYRTQCNDALWHGIFGGLYLPNLRNNIYSAIIESQNLLDEQTGMRKKTTVFEKDINFDGVNEILFKNTSIACMIEPHDGGQLTAFDDRGAHFNFQNTLSRRKEGYHEQLKSPAPPPPQTDAIHTIHDLVLRSTDEIRQYLSVDWYNRNSFVDHFVDQFDVADFIEGSFQEKGDFANRPFDVLFSPKEHSVQLSRLGGIYHADAEERCSLLKTFQLKKKGLSFSITATRKNATPMQYVLEFNFHFNDFQALTINHNPVSEGMILTDKKFMLCDHVLPHGISLTFTQPQTMYAFRVNTVSQSEQTVDITCQGICLLFPILFNTSVRLDGALEIE